MINIQKIDDYKGVSVFSDTYMENDKIMFGRKQKHALDPGYINVNTEEWDEALSKISYKSDNPFFKSKEDHINKWNHSDLEYFIVSENFDKKRYEVLIDEILKVTKQSD